MITWVTRFLSNGTIRREGSRTRTGRRQAHYINNTHDTRELCINYIILHTSEPRRFVSSLCCVSLWKPAVAAGGHEMMDGFASHSSRTPSVVRQFSRLRFPCVDGDHVSLSWTANVMLAESVCLPHRTLVAGFDLASPTLPEVGS